MLKGRALGVGMVTHEEPIRHVRSSSGWNGAMSGWKSPTRAARGRNRNGMTTRTARALSLSLS